MVGEQPTRLGGSVVSGLERCVIAPQKVYRRGSFNLMQISVLF